MMKSDLLQGFYTKEVFWLDDMNNNTIESHPLQPFLPENARILMPSSTMAYPMKVEEKAEFYKKICF